jgi:hypothetical protein
VSKKLHVALLSHDFDNLGAEKIFICTLKSHFALSSSQDSLDGPSLSHFWLKLMLMEIPQDTESESN